MEDLENPSQSLTESTHVPRQQRDGERKTMTEQRTEAGRWGVMDKDHAVADG